MNGIEPIAESRAGNYLIGNTTFNPFTNEKFYWIKVGTAVDLQSRMRNYNTHTPVTYIINFEYFTREGDCETIRIKNERLYNENRYHAILEKLFAITDTENRTRTSREWFRVTETEYLKICKYGFRYLENAIKVMDNYDFWDCRAKSKMQFAKVVTLRNTVLAEQG